jgi:hypothetical protein
VCRLLAFFDGVLPGADFGEGRWRFRSESQVIKERGAALWPLSFSFHIKQPDSMKVEVHLNHHLDRHGMPLIHCGAEAVLSHRIDSFLVKSHV